MQLPPPVPAARDCISNAPLTGPRRTDGACWQWLLQLERRDPGGSIEDHLARRMIAR